MKGQIYATYDAVGLPNLIKRVKEGYKLTAKEVDAISSAFDRVNPLPTLQELAALFNSIGTGSLPPNVNTTASSVISASEPIVEHSGRLLKAAGVIGARTIPALMVASIVTSGVGFAGELNPQPGPDNQQRTPNGQPITPDVRRQGWQLFIQYQLANLVTFGGMSLDAAQRHLLRATDGMPELQAVINSIPMNHTVSVVGVSDDIRRFERQYGNFANLSTIYEDMAVLSDAADLLVSSAAQNLTPEQRAAAIATLRAAYRASQQPEAEIQRIRAFVTNIETARGDRRTMNPDMRSILQSAAQLAELGPNGGALHSNGYWMGLRNVF
jgi:hypothetical protein